MMDGNDEKFQVRKNGRDTTVTLNSDCSTTRRAGGWCYEQFANGHLLIKPFPEVCFSAHTFFEESLKSNINM